MEVKIKIKESWLSYLPEIMFNYTDYITTVINEFRNEKITTYQENYLLIQLSISQQLQNSFKLKDMKPKSNKNNKMVSFKIDLHQRIIFYNALKHHEKNTSDERSKSAACQIATYIDQKKPSLNQINPITLLTS